MRKNEAVAHRLFEKLKIRSNTKLETFLPSVATEPTELHEAMRYAVFNGGKRIRAILVYATAIAVGGDDFAADWPAGAVELIHAYSLVHDDLPSMDDDDLRRGKPACHKAFGEATALLAGDALQTQAFLVLSETPLDPTQVKAMTYSLANASGSTGMAGGQAIDLAATGQSLTLGQLENMHIRKTGALIRASVQLGAFCKSGLVDDDLNKLDNYAKAIGLAFQIRDDILDVEGSTKQLGKPQGADLAHNKPTYTSLLGLQAAKEQAERQHETALEALAGYSATADLLRHLSEYIVSRNN